MIFGKFWWFLSMYLNYTYQFPKRNVLILCAHFDDFGGKTFWPILAYFFCLAIWYCQVQLYCTLFYALVQPLLSQKVNCLILKNFCTHCFFFFLFLAECDFWGEESGILSWISCLPERLRWPTLSTQSLGIQKWVPESILLVLLFVHIVCWEFSFYDSCCIWDVRH